MTYNKQFGGRNGIAAALGCLGETMWPSVSAKGQRAAEPRR